MNETQIRDAIGAAINKIRQDSGRETVVPQDGDAMTGELGLDSLDLAVLVVTLEQQLGVDPWRDGTQSARTFGDVVQIYERAKAAT